MKYFSLLLFALFFSCNQPKKEVKKTIPVETEKQEIIVVEKTKEIPIAKTTEELVIVLKDANNIIDAKALIENSGLTWSNLAINETNLKAAFIKVPVDKKDFWIERLKASNVFSSVEINSEEVIDKIKYITENTFVKIRKTHCSGDCPVFDITVFKDGKVLFNGVENVLITGIKEFKLSENQLEKVKNLFSKTTFSTYSNAFVDKGFADYPSTFITHQNKEIEIKLWKNVPEELIKAHEFLDEILLENKLIE